MLPLSNSGVVAAAWCVLSLQENRYQFSSGWRVFTWIRFGFPGFHERALLVILYVFCKYLLYSHIREYKKSPREKVFQ